MTTELSNERLERAVAALVPFVQAWSVQLNPEHLYEIAYAVLIHGESATSFEEIDGAARKQLREADERFSQRGRGLSNVAPFGCASVLK